jgi:hypothetical protein
MPAIQFLLGGGAEDPAVVTSGSLAAFRYTSQEEQGLLLPAQAAHILSVSHQCVLDLIDRERLRSWDFFGKTYVSARDVAERQRLPRAKGGRPRKSVVSLQAA